MKRKLLALICVLGTCVMFFCSCGVEEKGVPQEQIENEIYPMLAPRNFVMQEITHDIDKTMHTDTVTVEYAKFTKYVRADYVKSFVYQYNKQTDIWSFKNWLQEDKTTVTLYESLRNTNWTGREDLGLGTILCYNVTVDDINTPSGWIHITYSIQFSGKEYTGDAYFGYEEFSIEEGLFTFNFDPDEGIKVYR